MNSKVTAGGYTLIFRAPSDAIRDELVSVLEEQKQQLIKQLKVELDFEALQDQRLIIQLIRADHLNGNKLLKQLIKQLTRVQGHLQEVLKEKNWHLLTAGKRPSEGGRLEKLFHGIKETYYVDVKHIYGPEPHMLYNFFKDRKMSILENEDQIFLIDELGLLQRINLNCQACTSSHEFGCCCGSPCQYSSQNLKRYKIHEQAIIEEMKQIEPSYYEAVKKKRREEGSPDMMLVDFDGTVGECEGRCMLLVREEGMAKCLAHKYALEHQIPVYELSPLSCLLFPLEIIGCITDKGKRLFLLTSVVEDELATHIGRWGSYKSLELPLCCIDESLCNETFKKEDYESVLQVNKGLLSYEFGESIYEDLTYLLGEGRVAKALILQQPHDG